jgi:hypothetical protein
MKRHHQIDDMPYAPAYGDDRCDLCGEPADALTRVVLEPASKVNYNGKVVNRVARVAYACRRHRGEEAVGVPITTPNLTMLKGTSKLRPQREVPFDDPSLKRRGS